MSVSESKPLVLVSLLLAAFAINLDTTIVNVALPTLVRELHASPPARVDRRRLQLVFAAFVLAAGNLGDRVGRKGVLLCRARACSAPRALPGAGKSPGELIAAHAVMGSGRR